MIDRILHIIIGFSVAVACPLSLSSQASSNQPNVVIIYGDDVSYGDVSAYDQNKSPRLI